MSFSMTKPFNKLYLTLEQSELNFEHLLNLRPTGKLSKPSLCVSACTGKKKKRILLLWILSKMIFPRLFPGYKCIWIGQKCNATVNKCQKNLCPNSKIRKMNKKFQAYTMLIKIFILFSSSNSKKKKCRVLCSCIDLTKETCLIIFQTMCW